ncbi:MAG TPA: mechanosensitive ion channel domain-containing protein [Baekduia sp.]|uniref:mechanosensitive ion channel family protein n=1 Tax=Baekduia sp. TaxID=2600305 RepID=UPI002B61FB7F|nr:mechanosensitive ion channel domain-containing protein [Baekduia sp.]HMJ33830.1 mechanosensitive ion channel domain-containing protein [Baekduia sp.]
MRTIVAAQSFLDKYANLFTAVGTIIAAVVAVVLVDRFLVHRASSLAHAVAGDRGLSRDAATRLRFARRAIEAIIVLIAFAVALSQFDSLDRVGRTILASSAITAAIVGFAARQTLANGVAGILLAIVQPIRIGDLVTFEGETGTVEDVGLAYTWLRTGADARILIPNERLASGVLRNDSIRSPTVAVQVSVWVAPDAEESVAVAALNAIEGVSARIEEATHEGLRLLVTGAPGPPSERLAHEGDLRASALAALRAAGVRG